MNLTSTTTTTTTTAHMDHEIDRTGLATLLAVFTTPDGKPKYGRAQGKPVIYIDVKTVLTDQSDKFQDKLLCDGLTMNAGDACVFSCTFCYVPGAMVKLHKARLGEFNRETGLNLSLDRVVIRRRGFLEVLKGQLLRPDGSRIYDDPDDRRVLYSSTLVDVAATMDLLRETAAACILIFEHTEWQIRLLSKSPLLAKLVTKELIPAKYHPRLILGFSTGTLDDDIAAAIEKGTGKVSRRIKALHELQDRGIRTFGMICPSLPYGTQKEYDEFSRRMCEALRIERCEHVWAEVINLRGESLTKTVEALGGAGYETEARRLEAVSIPGSKAAWEQYARMTFEAHRKHVPEGKLRFLQYVNKDTAECWSCQRQCGAVLLGSHAEKNHLITIEASASVGQVPDLEDNDIRYRREREEVVTGAISHSLAAAKALYEIKSYRDGLLWRKEFRTFADYCANRWAYQKSQAYRQVQTGDTVGRKVDGVEPRQSGIRRIVDRSALLGRQRRHPRVPEGTAGHMAHHVEHRADDVVVGAQHQRFGNGEAGAEQRVRYAVFAVDGVGRGQQDAGGLAPQDIAAAGGVKQVGRVRLPALELLDPDRTAKFLERPF